MPPTPCSRPSRRTRSLPTAPLAGLVALVLVGLLAGCGAGGRALAVPAVALDAPAVAPDPQAFEADVVRVVDGDTVVARRPGRPGTVRVRLVGVDTPESVKPGTPVACFGHEASAFTTRLLAGQRVAAAYQAEHQDRYGRELWDLWLPDGRWVQGLLVASGAARAYPFPPNTAHAADLAAAQQAAEQQRRGLWGGCRPAAAFPQLARGGG